MLGLEWMPLSYVKTKQLMCFELNQMKGHQEGSLRRR